MKKLKNILALTLTLAMTLALVACGPATDASGTTTDTNQGTSTAATTQLTWWIFPNFVQDNGAQPGTYEQSVVDAFQKIHPEIKITIETLDFQSGPDKITSAIQGGTAPDILFDAPGRIIDYGNNGKLASLDDMFTEEMIKDINNDAIIEASKGNGVAYMYPISTSPFYMSINKDMWEKSGAMQYVNLEGDRSWTTDDFEKAIYMLKDAGYVPGTLYSGKQGGDQGTRAFLSNLYGATIADNAKSKYTFDSAEGLKALQTAKKWLTDGVLGNGTAYAGGDDIEQFVSGNFSYELCWGRSTYLSNVEKLNSFHVNTISLPFPSNDGVPTLEYLVNGFCVFDNGDQARIDASKTFLKYICDDATVGPEAVKHTGAFPVRQSFGDLYAGDEEMALLSDWTQYYAPYYNTMKGFTQMRVEWYTMLQAITTGEKTPEVALQDYIKNSNAAMVG